MPVRNGMPFLDRAVGSILEQDMSDFEFVILDDASTDDTHQSLQDWSERDARIRILRQHRPLGPVGSSQLVVAEAKAPLIARMDADDVSRSDRLGVQRMLMEQHSGAALVASLARGIDAKGKVVRPVDLRRLRPGRATLPAPHSTWMFRREAFDAAGGYLVGTEGWEDASLFHRLAGVGGVLLLPDALVDFRYHLVGSTVTHSQEARERALADQERAFAGAPKDNNVSCDVESSAVAPDAYRLRAAMRVWSGYRPDIGARFPRIGSRRWPARSLAVLVYATWGRVAPRSLRAVMAWMISARNRFHGADFPTGRPVVWRKGLS